MSNPAQTSDLNHLFHLASKSYTTVDRRGWIPYDNLANVAAQLPRHTIRKMQNLGACSRDDRRRESQRRRSLMRRRVSALKPVSRLACRALRLLKGAVRL